MWLCVCVCAWVCFCISVCVFVASFSFINLTFSKRPYLLLCSHAIKYKTINLCFFGFCFDFSLSSSKLFVFLFTQWGCTFQLNQLLYCFCYQSILYQLSLCPFLCVLCPIAIETESGHYKLVNRISLFVVSTTLLLMGLFTPRNFISLGH